jgi:hypothetical protein
MWQRIQTVFLVIAILSLVASIFLPVWVLRDGAQRHELYALHFTEYEAGTTKANTSYLPYSTTAILIIAAITLSVIEIMKFRDRLLQIKLGTLNSLILAGALGSAVYFATSMLKTYEGGQYGFGLWLPAVAVICNWLAMRFIRRDEKLVRDSDRLR